MLFFEVRVLLISFDVFSHPCYNKQKSHSFLHCFWTFLIPQARLLMLPHPQYKVTDMSKSNVKGAEKSAQSVRKLEIPFSSSYRKEKPEVSFL
jgi:hypothetical protein